MRRQLHWVFFYERIAMTENENFLAANAANPQVGQVCPTCSTVGGYCGGSGHLSCSCFWYGRPVSLVQLVEEERKLQAQS
jgi:hypothetical protein